MTRNLFIDIVNRRLVASFDSDTPASLAPFIQGDTDTVNIYPLRPAADPTQGPFTYADDEFDLIRIALCGGSGKPVGTAGTPPYVAFQNAHVAIAHGYQLTLSLATVELAAFIGSADQKASTFEVEVTNLAGQRETILSIPATANADVIDPDAQAPAPTDQFYTKEESDARFAPIGEAGGSGDVVGPATAVDGEITLFNGITGKLIKSAGQTIAALLASARDRATHTGTQLAATISDFASAALAAVTWSTISGKPSTFTPSAHAHAISDITSLQDALDAKAAKSALVPANTAAPAITGTAEVGQELSASTGSWNWFPTGYAYKWQRNDGGGWADINGATASTYTVQAADEGCTLRVGVRASNDLGDGSFAFSDATSEVPASQSGPWGIDTFEIAAGGSGYAVDDWLWPPGGTPGNDANMKVASVDENGGVTGITKIDGGIYETQPSNPILCNTSGAGNGCQINVTGWV